MRDRPDGGDALSAGAEGDDDPGVLAITTVRW
jgi:hypothetical protein